jgi:NADH-quinone oxidoreductase subunit M
MDTILFNLIWVIPLFTVLACIPIPESHAKLLRGIHTVSASVVLAIVCYLTFRVYAMGSASASEAAAPLLLRFFTDIPWLSMIGAHYIVGADGLNILLLALTAFIVWAGVLVSYNIKGNQKVFFALIQISQQACMACT